MNFYKVSVSILPRCLDICIKSTCFNIYHCIASKIGFENGPSKQPKLPLQEKIILSAGNGHHSSSSSTNSRRASRRSKKHSEGNYIQKLCVQCTTSWHSQKLLKRFKEKTALRPKAPAVHIKRAIAKQHRLYKFILSKIRSAMEGKQQECLA